MFINSTNNESNWSSTTATIIPLFQPDVNSHITLYCFTLPHNGMVMLTFVIHFLFAMYGICFGTIAIIKYYLPAKELLKSLKIASIACTTCFMCSNMNNLLFLYSTYSTNGDCSDRELLYQIVSISGTLLLCFNYYTLYFIFAFKLSNSFKDSSFGLSKATKFFLTFNGIFAIFLVGCLFVVVVYISHQIVTLIIGSCALIYYIFSSIVLVVILLKKMVQFYEYRRDNCLGSRSRSTLNINSLQYITSTYSSGNGSRIGSPQSGSRVVSNGNSNSVGVSPVVAVVAAVPSIATQVPQTTTTETSLASVAIDIMETSEIVKNTINTIITSVNASVNSRENSVGIGIDDINIHRYNNNGHVHRQHHNGISNRNDKVNNVMHEAIIRLVVVYSLALLSTIMMIMVYMMDAYFNTSDKFDSSNNNSSIIDYWHAYFLLFFLFEQNVNIMCLLFQYTFANKIYKRYCGVCHRFTKRLCHGCINIKGF